MTSDRSVPEATDDTPYNTSTGERVHSGGIAVSRDLLCGACRKLHHQCQHPEYDKKLHYGQWLYVKKYGFLQVNDVMGPTKYDKKTKKHYVIRQSIDIWTTTYANEKKIGLTIQPVYKVEVR